MADGVLRLLSPGRCAVTGLSAEDLFSYFLLLAKADGYIKHGHLSEKARFDAANKLFPEMEAHVRDGGCLFCRRIAHRASLPLKNGQYCFQHEVSRGRRCGLLRHFSWTKS